MNERLVERHFANEDPIGGQIRVQTGAPEPAWLTIVGVSRDMRQRAVADVEPLVYVPVRRTAPAEVALIVRTAGEDSAGITPLVREVVRGLDPTLPVYRALPLAQTRPGILVLQPTSS